MKIFSILILGYIILSFGTQFEKSLAQSKDPRIDPYSWQELSDKELRKLGKTVPAKKVKSRKPSSSQGKDSVDPEAATEPMASDENYQLNITPQEGLDLASEEEEEEDPKNKNKKSNTSSKKKNSNKASVEKKSDVKTPEELAQDEMRNQMLMQSMGGLLGGGLGGGGGDTTSPSLSQPGYNPVSSGGGSGGTGGGTSGPAPNMCTPESLLPLKVNGSMLVGCGGPIQLIYDPNLKNGVGGVCGNLKVSNRLAQEMINVISPCIQQNLGGCKSLTIFHMGCARSMAERPKPPSCHHTLDAIDIAGFRCDGKHYHSLKDKTLFRNIRGCLGAQGLPTVYDNASHKDHLHVSARGCTRHPGVMVKGTGLKEDLAVCENGTGGNRNSAGTNSPGTATSN